MSPEQKTLVQQSWRQIEPIADQAASLFYDRLFTLDPALRRLFAKTDMTHQRSRLTLALIAVVGGLDQVDRLVPELRALGRRHHGYGVTDGHYETVGGALLWTLEQGLGPDWSDELQQAWSAAYGLVAKVMQDGAAEAMATEPGFQVAEF